jgi:hypothetical protein
MSGFFIEIKNIILLIPLNNIKVYIKLVQKIKVLAVSILVKVVNSSLSIIRLPVWYFIY